MASNVLYSQLVGGSESNTPYTDHEGDFQTVGSSRRRPKKRKTREGSLSVENISLRANSSSGSEYEYQDVTDFRTPSADTKILNLKVFINPIDREKSLKNISLITIAKSIKNCCGSPPEFIKPTRTGILVKCTNAKQHKRLTEIELIGNIPVQINNQPNLLRGVISGVPTEMTEKEIEIELKGQKVVNVKRIVRKSQRKSESDMETQESATPTRSVILSFELKSLPLEINLCFQKIEVRPYIPYVKRCFRCQRFGHTVATCRDKQRCVRCGREHIFDVCPHKDKPTCINCGGQHSAAYQGCEEAKKAKEIQRIKIVNKLTYAQAAKKLTENQQNIEQASTIPTPNQDSRITIDKRRIQTVVQAQIHRNPEPIINQANKASNHTELKLPKIPTPEKTMKETATRSTQQKDNFLTTATNEELITFFVKLLVNFVSQSEAEVITIIRTAAYKFNAPPNNPMQAS